MFNVCLLSVVCQPHDIRDFVGLIDFCVLSTETTAWHTVGAQ